MQSGSERLELRPLTSLRFGAALLVFLYHCTATSTFAATYALGHSGVGFFFLLSGFILTYTYLAAFTTAPFGRTLREFYVARFARIYPVHAVTMVLALLVLLAWGGPSWSATSGVEKSTAIVAQALLLQSWIPVESVYLGVNSVAWSISVEAFLYALFPFVVRSLSRTFFGVPPLTIVAAAAAAWIVQTAVFLIPHHVDVWTSYVAPPIRFLDFLVGMLAAIAFAQTAGRTSRRTATLREIAAVGVLAAVIAASPHFPLALRYSLALMPVWASIVFVFARGGGVLSQVLSHRVAVMLGEVSFAFYLVHTTMIAVTSHVFGNTAPAVTAFVAFAASLGAGFALHVAVERPMRVRLRSLFVRRSDLAHVKLAMSTNR